MELNEATETVKYLVSQKLCDKMATSFFLHKSNLTWLQILVYQKLVTEQVTDDIGVMAAELKVKVKVKQT